MKDKITVKEQLKDYRPLIRQEWCILYDMFFPYHHNLEIFKVLTYRTRDGVGPLTERFFALDNFVNWIEYVGLSKAKSGEVKYDNKILYPKMIKK